MLTKAENTPREALSTALASPCDALITRRDGRRVDTRVLWAPQRSTLDAALSLFVALAISDGEGTIVL